MSELDRQQIFCDLERCNKQYKSNEEMESECMKCTYHGMGVDCVLELISDSFSLVKELLEENESLAKTVNEASELIRKLRSKVNKSKSEVDNLKVLLEMKEKAYEGLKELYDMDIEALINARKKTEVEVAWEIFEEIETCMKDFEDDDGYLLKKCEFEFFMRELKKEYAEEKE